MKAHRRLRECLAHWHRVTGRKLAGIFLWIQQKEISYLVGMFYLTMYAEMCDAVLPGSDTQCSHVRTHRINLTASGFVTHTCVTKSFFFLLCVSSLCFWIMAQLKHPAPVTIRKGMLPVLKSEFAIQVQYRSL